ncbi:MAG: hypothetical protein ACM3ST_14835 [Bdellovibrio bacteriovorus]
MRNRELRRVEQRWSREDLFSRRRRRLPWRWILGVLALVALLYALMQADLDGIWGSLSPGPQAPDETPEAGGDGNRLPLPPRPEP